MIDEDSAPNIFLEGSSFPRVLGSRPGTEDMYWSIETLSPGSKQFCFNNIVGVLCLLFREGDLVLCLPIVQAAQRGMQQFAVCVCLGLSICF